ncbi:hypothetical protein [Tenacibaculum piscium]|uniref:hypothetical protein n=1 Tax=Tenacibaculum piscium TaxID=1458515 RepID=UPI00187B30E5|nr:hypothetical protein [Tenacibaculum piscium]MBE7630493.1 hypothetical protein [Tenacibaculum piscium]MBE7670957.1 hypothetical protein [Tenacibaculum piscium]
MSNPNPNIVPEISLKHEINSDDNDLWLSVYRVPISKEDRDKLISKINDIFSNLF